jgi:CRP/FNR family transcriptional regulator
MRKFRASNPPNRIVGLPALLAPPIWSGGRDGSGYHFRAEDCAGIAAFATVVGFRKGQTIYQEGQRAASVFQVMAGIAKAYRDQPAQDRHVAGFLFPGDLFGLAQGGRYVNSAEAVTSLTLCSLPVTALEPRLYRNPNLDFVVICKLCQELCEAQRHAYLLSRRSAAARVALFLQMLERCSKRAMAPPARRSGKFSCR